jgi:hypothetical protein
VGGEPHGPGRAAGLGRRRPGPGAAGARRGRRRRPRRVPRRPGRRRGGPAAARRRRGGDLGLPLDPRRPAAGRPCRPRRADRRIRALAPDEAVVSTSFHQSPLPLALVLRTAGVPRISAISVDYPGSLLDVRHRVDDDLPEPERACPSPAPRASTCRPATTAGSPCAGPCPRSRPNPRPLTCRPGTSSSTPAPPYPPGPGRRTAGRGGRGAGRRRTPGAGHRRAGGAGAHRDRRRDPRRRPRRCAGPGGAGRAARRRRGGGRRQHRPGHLAAAVGTPVVSLFSPVVPAARWAPYGVPTVLLGDQDAPCRLTRAASARCPATPASRR